MRLTMQAILAIGIMAILFISPVQATCFISATADNSQVSWGDTITFMGSAECSSEVTFRLKDGPGLPAAGILLGTTTPSDGTYEFGWDTGTTKQEYSLAGGQYTVYITSEPDGQYTRVRVLLSSAAESTPEETEMPSPAETETTETILPAMTEMKTTRTTPPTLTRTETTKIPSPAMTEVTQISTKTPAVVPTQAGQTVTTTSAVPNDVISQVVNFFKGLFGLK